MATVTSINGWNIGGNNNSFDQRGHFYRGVFSGNVTGMLVKQNSTPNMTVLVEHGSALLNKNTTSASIAEIKSDTSVTIDTANTSNPRIDTVVIYEDTSVAIPTVENDYWQDGAGGRFKVVSLPGTAAASPVAISDASIQTAIGAGKPWTRLANITVPANSTTIINSNIADKRVQMGGNIPNNSVTTAAIANNAVTAGKLNSASFISPDSAGWKVTTLPSGKKQYRRVVVGTDVSIGGGNSGATQTVAPPTGISGTDILSGLYSITSTYTSNATGWDRLIGKTSISPSTISVSVYNSISGSLNTGNQARWFLVITEM